MFFLLQTKQNDKSAEQDLGFNFIPYNYGPYSRILQLDINYLIERSFLKEEPEIDRSGKCMYRYEITDKGKMLVDRILNEPEYAEYRFRSLHKILREIKSDINDKKLGLLLREIYTDYPEYAQFSKYEF